mmetsp:Transcript_13141/g.19661  ORF Transcript_13141/g.19661 Transcript_13141/m.19661 type:complete len:832 (-) Transcript_13141:86-2581(-)
MQQLPSPYVHAMAPAPKVAVVGKIEIRQIINKWQRHREYGFAPTNVAAPWIKMMDEFLKENAFLTKCYDVEGGRFQPCSCLSILQNEPYRQAVARYSVKFLQRPSDEQNQIIIDMQKDASAKSSERYPLPYDCGEMEEAVVALDQHRICRFAMGTITQMGSWRWNNNKRLSSTTGVAKEHGNVKKRRTKRSTTAQNHAKKQATTAATIEAATTTDVADDGACTQLREYDVDDWRDNDQMEGHDETVDMAFHKSSGRLSEFLTLRERLPTLDATNSAEKECAEFIIKCRHDNYNGCLNEDKVGLLNNINLGILADELQYVTDRNLTYTTDEWKHKFDELANRAAAASTLIDHKPTAAVNWLYTPSSESSYNFQSTNESFISIEGVSTEVEFMIRRMRGCLLACPHKCNKDATPGTIEDIFSYAIDSQKRQNALSRHSAPSCRVMDMEYDANYIRDYNEQYDPDSHRSGSYFPPPSQPVEYKTRLANAMDELLPNGLLEKYQNCESLDQFRDLENQHRQLYDNFHFPEGGIGHRPVTRIMDTTYPQPRRMGFSVTTGDSLPFPELATDCRRLYSYGATGRVTADGRSRPMSQSVYTLMIETWKHVHNQLSPLSRVCPPNNLQVLVYTKIREGGRLVWKQQMTPHKDNGFRNYKETGRNKQYGGNPSQWLNNNSQIEGTDVVTVNVGDEMTYKLIKPNKSQTYMFTQKDAKSNKTDERLLHSTALEDGSILVHSAHDDEFYYHAVDFHEDNETDSYTKVRVALVFRWLSVPSYYRCNPGDDLCNRHSLISKVAFEEIARRPLTSNNWLRALKYDREMLESIMDYLPTPGQKRNK